jgi:hypothetical protein
MKKQILRVLAIALALAMLLTIVLSVIVSSAHGEAPSRDFCSMEITYDEEGQALLITQRLSYSNRTGAPLDRVRFALYANQFRREDTVMYESAAALPEGYAPGGVAFSEVSVNGKSADWGVEGDGAYFLRVACDLAPGEVAEFSFSYAALFARNAGFWGAGDVDLRFSGFYPVPCLYENGRWQANAPVQHSRYLLAAPADYSVKITLPDEYLLTATGDAVREKNGDGTSTWAVEAAGIREFAMSIGRAWRVFSGATDSGVGVRVYTNSRLGGRRALGIAKETISLYESWLGAFPTKNVNIVESDYALSRLSFSGEIWLSSALFDWQNREALADQLRYALAEQYFGLSVYADPLADAWMSVSVCEYLAYLSLEEFEGRDAFLRRLNGRVLDALQITVPGDLTVTTDGLLFTQSEFDIVVRDRGAAVMHELRHRIGRDAFLAALARYYADCRDKTLVVERDLVRAINDSTGADWEPLLTDLLFNIGDYADNYMDWYE